MIESFKEASEAAEKASASIEKVSEIFCEISQTPCFTTPLWKETPSVMISINPKWCELIASGRKTIEIRKTRPKTETPFKCYIYETKGKTDTPFMDEDGHLDFHGRGQVIGEFICDEIINIKPFGFEDVEEFEKQTCLNSAEIVKYLNGFYGYGWHISDLVIYDKAKELSGFYTHDNKAVQKCENRIQTYYSFTDTGYIKNGMYCDYRDDWCIKCKRKPLKRPFQSWGYAENYAEDT